MIERNVGHVLWVSGMSTRVPEPAESAPLMDTSCCIKSAHLEGVQSCVHMMFGLQSSYSRMEVGLRPRSLGASTIFQ